MKLENREISPRSPYQAIRLGIGMITNDRQKENIAMTQSVKDNIIITSLNEFKTRFRTLKGKKLKKVSDQYIEKLSVKTTGGSQLIQFLSGGNQQKVVVAKWSIGIARTFAYGGSRGRKIYDPEIKPKMGMNKEEYRNNQDSTSINHFYEKLLLLKDMMNTTEGKKLAEHRQAVMQEFLNEFMIEWEGKM